jgi:hypothetical protein
MKSIRLPRLALLALVAFALPACNLLKPKPPVAEVVTEEPKKAKPLFEWDDAKIDSVKGPLSMRISVDTQRATLYRGSTPVAWTTVATGVWKYPTPAGKFRISEKTPDKNSNLYGKIYNKNGKCVNSDAKLGRDPIPEGGKFEGSRLRYWMRLTGDGVGMHVGPIPSPGRRASHGCVRLPSALAARMYARLPSGTPVTITDSNPPPRPKPDPKPAVPKTPVVAPATTPADPATPAPATPAPATPAPATPAAPEVTPAQPAPTPTAPAVPTTPPAAPAVKAPTEPATPPQQ